MPTDEGAKTKEGLNGSDYHRSRSAEVEGAPTAEAIGESSGRTCCGPLQRFVVR
jgi:hypothetical protein